MAEVSVDGAFVFNIISNKCNKTMTGCYEGALIDNAAACNEGGLIKEEPASEEILVGDIRSGGYQSGNIDCGPRTKMNAGLIDKNNPACSRELPEDL